MKKCKVGVVQMNTGVQGTENVRAIKEAAAYAAEEGVQFLLYPETAEYIGPQMTRRAEKIPGYMTRVFAGLARNHKMYIHCGSLTENTGMRKSCNTSLVFSPRGEIIASYRKTHLFDVELENGPSYRESAEILPGKGLVLAELPMADFGLSICYDLRFPELYRLLTLKGAEVLCVAANFTKETGAKHWETLLRARAIENTCYVLAANQCGQKTAFAAYGHSMIIDPFGEIIAEAGEEPQILVAELDKEVLLAARRQIPSLQNRREDLYRLEGSVEVQGEGFV